MKVKGLLGKGFGLFLSAVVSLSPIMAQAAPVTMPDGNVFDPEYYAEQNPDVVVALGKNSDVLYRHYQLCGKAEGRLPYAQVPVQQAQQVQTSERFDSVFYADTYPDLKAVFGYDSQLLYNHYITSGKAEGRIGAPALITYHGMTESDIYNRLIALKEFYPEGMKWDASLGSYSFKGLNERESGIECVAYAYQISDRVFGNEPDAKYVYHFAREKFHVGDIVRFGSWWSGHSVVVLEVKPEGIVCTEGNYDGKVHWGRLIKWNRVERDFSFLLSRYDIGPSEEPDEEDFSYYGIDDEWFYFY